MNHAQEARDLIGVGIESMELKQLPHAQATLAMAQVHATLALVEQQRIANLIELTHNQNGGLVFARALYEMQGKNVKSIRPEISEALGLGDPE